MVDGWKYTGPFNRYPPESLPFARLSQEQSILAAKGSKSGAAAALDRLLAQPVAPPAPSALPSAAAPLRPDPTPASTGHFHPSDSGLEGTGFAVTPRSSGSNSRTVTWDDGYGGISLTRELAAARGEPADWPSPSALPPYSDEQPLLEAAASSRGAPGLANSIGGIGGIGGGGTAGSGVVVAALLNEALAARDAALAQARSLWGSLVESRVSLAAQQRSTAALTAELEGGRRATAEAHASASAATSDAASHDAAAYREKAALLRRLGAAEAGLDDARRRAEAAEAAAGSLGDTVNRTELERLRLQREATRAGREAAAATARCNAAVAEASGLRAELVAA